MRTIAHIFYINALPNSFVTFVFIMIKFSYVGILVNYVIIINHIPIIDFYHRFFFLC